MARYDAYDPFARIYDRHWGGFAEGIYPILDHLVLRKLPHGCAVMDLCCGTGQLARRLSNEGYDTTGVDGSQQMIAIARENAPNAEFLVEDARNISLDRTFSAVFSTYDSLNHVMELDELEQVFRRVYSMLEDGGYFAFDLNMEEGYLLRWRGTFALVEDDHACVVRASRDHAERTGRMDITCFELSGAHWERADLALVQRWYSEPDVRERLRRAGFRSVRSWDGKYPIVKGTPSDPGRTFFVARKLRKN